MPVWLTQSRRRQLTPDQAANGQDRQQIRQHDQERIGHRNPERRQLELQRSGGTKQKACERGSADPPLAEDHGGDREIAGAAGRYSAVDAIFSGFAEVRRIRRREKSQTEIRLSLWGEFVRSRSRGATIERKGSQEGEQDRGNLVAGDRYMAKPTIVEALFSYRRAA